MNTIRLSRHELRRLSVAWRPDKFQKLHIHNLPTPKPRPPKRVRRPKLQELPPAPPPRRDPFRILAPVGTGALAVAVFVALVVLTRQYRMEVFEVELGRPADEPEVERLEKVEEPQVEEVEKDVEVVVEEWREAVEVPALEVPAVSCVMNLAPNPAMAESVAMIRSPVTLKSVGGSERSAGGRIAALRKYGGTGAGEDAVLRALRYLKRLQADDGSWQFRGEGDPTAFALLAFLAHGEDFASPEFGGTVKAAVEYLLEHHGNNMATYALAEAAAVIRTPVLAEAAAVAVGEMCARQKTVIRANAGNVIARYCAVMAMVSAEMAGLAVPGLAETKARFAEGYAKMRDAKAGDWSKIRGKGVWHYMIASVCLQYLGRGGESRSQAMLAHLDRIWPPATLGETEIACCPVRSNYFSTMMFFNAGGDVWRRWNEGMIKAYVHAQTVEGKEGYWRCRDQHIGEQPFWSTVYIALQLMVYYRYLPTGIDKTAAPAAPPKADIPWPNWIDIEVDI